MIGRYLPIWRDPTVDCVRVCQCGCGCVQYRHVNTSTLEWASTQQSSCGLIFALFMSAPNGVRCRPLNRPLEDCRLGGWPLSLLYPRDSPLQTPEARVNDKENEKKTVTALSSFHTFLLVAATPRLSHRQDGGHALPLNIFAAAIPSLLPGKPARLERKTTKHNLIGSGLV
ncbi:unnamed protein product [Protopolystoma xenopodis]|uniref:Uncharacterized protein n=1 Tax=Protopolystoma xenopodis TaxID=117903 RepID=A0A448X4Q2_9PLAT|nr:unnamed protein product [Protopolystoma xenopodis]